MLHFGVVMHQVFSNKYTHILCELTEAAAAAIAFLIAVVVVITAVISIVIEVRKLL